MARPRTRNKTKLIVFLMDENDTETQYFGFKISTVDQAKRFLLAVKKLEENNITFNIGSEVIDFNSNHFSSISLASAEQKILVNLFDIDIQQTDNNGCIGIIPDAIGIAYDEGLLDEDQQQQQLEYQEDYY